MNILIVEDDIILGKNIEDSLKDEGFSITTARDGRAGEVAMESGSYDCIILDINLPIKNGFDLCRDYRASGKNTPILLLTAFDELEDKIEGYESGADDYLTKPFFMKELSLRIHALIKRNSVQTEHLNQNSTVKNLQVNDLVLDLQYKKVIRAGKEITLTPREFQILQKLIEADGAPVSKNDLVKEIWGSIFDHNTNTIEVYVNFLRNKIDKPFNSQMIKTRTGYGYYIDLK